MKRLEDIETFSSIMRKYKETIKGYTDEWILDTKNVALIEDDNLALFEYIKDGVYRGHYFFSDRGRKAINLSKTALDYIFSSAKIIEGLTPIENKGAIWMSKHLGFTAYGDIDTIAGKCKHFIMTQEEWRKLNG